MTDKPADPTVVAFPQPPPRDVMSERGARPITPPPPEPEKPERIGLFAADMTLRDLLTDVIRGDYTKLDWSVAEALRLVDPGEKSPPLMRFAARIISERSRAKSRSAVRSRRCGAARATP